MYKVFLADDEIVIREGIRNNFPWEASEFVLCGEAPDGEMALPMMQDLKPDILVTDIRMPFMDGLSLCRQVVKTMPWVHIIILSGYDDFTYAREAISLGVKEYLLKPVSAQKLEEVLLRIADKIQRERVRQADMDALRRQLLSSSRYARRQLLSQLLEGGDADALLPETDRLRMRLSAKRYLVMLLEPMPADDQLTLEGILQPLTEGADGAVQYTFVSGSMALLVMGESGEDVQERAYALAQALEHGAAQNGLPQPAIAIGAPVERLSDLPRALSSARVVLRTMQGQSRRIVGFMDMDLPLSAELMEGDLLPLYEQLRYAAQQEGARLVESYFDSLGGMAAQSLLLRHYMLVDMLLAATRIIRQCGGDPAQVLPARLTRQGELLRLSERPGDALHAGKEIVSAALSFRDRHAFSRYGEILRKALAYIDANHHRPEITLQDVASHVALSNNHFCTVFSQEMGITFTEHLTATRVAKAKELLAAGTLRTADVAHAVGYNDPHYFSYLFKKNTGMSPRDFRRDGKAGI